jgi:tRNA-Thr(GGU) m(6)t(6)A37 methyltransferase TsaA
MKPRTTAAGVAALMGLALSGGTGYSAGQDSFVLSPVGRIRVRDTGATIEIAPKHKDALLGLEGFSHVWVIWWFDRNDDPEKRAVLRVHPRGNPKNPLTGVFATRSPARPNLIGMTLCRIRSIQGNTIRVEDIDAFDNTPVLDLKPYIPRSDGDPEATVPSWIRDE